MHDFAHGLDARSRWVRGHSSAFRFGASRAAAAQETGVEAERDGVGGGVQAAAGERGAGIGLRRHRSVALKRLAHAIRARKRGEHP